MEHEGAEGRRFSLSLWRQKEAMGSGDHWYEAEVTRCAQSQQQGEREREGGGRRRRDRPENRSQSLALSLSLLWKLP